MSSAGKARRRKDDIRRLARERTKEMRIIFDIPYREAYRKALGWAQKKVRK